MEKETIKIIRFTNSISYRIGNESTVMGEQELGKCVGFATSTTPSSTIEWALIHFENGTIEFIGQPFKVITRIINKE